MVSKLRRKGSKKIYIDEYSILFFLDWNNNSENLVKNVEIIEENCFSKKPIIKGLILKYASRLKKFKNPHFVNVNN